MLGTIVKLCLLAAVILLVGVVLFRPAALFGVDAKGLANSLGGEVRHAEASCVGEGSGRWRCALRGSTVGAAVYTLTTHSYGCWTGTRVAMSPSSVPVDRTVSGCIGLTDMLGN